MNNHRSALLLFLCVLLFSFAVFLIGCVPIGPGDPPPPTVPSLNAPTAQTPVLVSLLAVLSPGGTWTDVKAKPSGDFEILPSGLPSGGMRILFRAPYPSDIQVDIDGSILEKTDDDNRIPTLQAEGRGGYYIAKINISISDPIADWEVAVAPPPDRRGPTPAGMYVNIKNISFNPNYSGADKVSAPLTIHAVVILPKAPSALHAESVNKNRIKLSWNDNSSDEIAFLIERKLGTSGSYSQIATVGANKTTFTDENLTTGSLYYYRVRASNANGNSPYSNESSAIPQRIKGELTVTLDQQVGGGWYIYSLDHQYDPLAFTDNPHAAIDSVENAETVFPYTLAHKDGNNQQTLFIPFNPGDKKFDPFKGLEVEGSWTAQFNGKQVDAPHSLRVTIKWVEP